MNTSEMPSIDFSESPTQLNEGRSYDRYQDPLSSGPSQLNPNEGLLGLGTVDDDLPERTLSENDTGAVNFGPVDSGGLNSDSSLPNDPGTITRGFSHFFSHSDDDPPQAAPAEGPGGALLRTLGAPPETPAPPRNPFAGKFQTPLLAGSQLFGQTPSSAFPMQGSPTSSRPSPSDLPVRPTVTPAGVGIFSALDAGDTQTPPVNLMPLSTSSQSRFDGYNTTPRPAQFSEPPGPPEQQETPETPEIPDPLEPPIAAQSSPTGRKRKAPGPMEEYVSVRQSQMQREASDIVRRPPSGDHKNDRDSNFDSSSDDGADGASQMRRRRARRKREEGAKMLSTISLSRSLQKDDIVEVPASTRKEHPARSSGRRQPLGRQPIPEILEVCPGSDAQAAEEEETKEAKEGDTTMMETSGDVPPAHNSVEEVDVPESFVANSADAKGPPLSFSNTPYSPVPGPSVMVPATERKRKSSTHPMGSLNEAYTIPETSPAVNHERDDIPLTNPPSVVGSSQALPQQYAGQDHLPPASQTASSVVHTSDAILPAEEKAQTSAVPAVPMSDDLEQRLPLLRQTHDEGLSSTPRAEEQAKQDVIRDTSPVSSSPPPMLPPAFSTRAQKRRVGNIDTDTKANQPKLPRSVSSVARSASTVSSLSGTPSLPSREATPITAASDLSSEKKTLSGKEIKAEASVKTGVLSSPNLKRKLRRHAPSAANRKRQASPSPSGSTDELAGSPASVRATLEASVPRAVRKTATRSGLRPPPAHDISPNSHQKAQRATRIFGGMAFAISFQSKRPGETEDSYNDRMDQAKTLEHRIREAGGTVLHDGFDELFEEPPVMHQQQQRRHQHHLQHYQHGEAVGPEPADLQLCPDTASMGFTVLVADGHSRKSKYMQALALGLPCLAPRWVTTCLDKAAATNNGTAAAAAESDDTLIDWAPYLLCAGQSSFLGDGAIRSRNLVPYEADTARLADVVQARPRLLAGMSILLVVRRGNEERTRRAYIFLVHVLGASLSRAHSIEEARERLVAMEAAGRPFDWVYLDGKDGSNAGDGLFLKEDPDPASPPPPPSKRRKRSSAATATTRTGRGAAHPAPKRVKVLTDERVVQSLILGKWIEDDELGM